MYVPSQRCFEIFLSYDLQSRNHSKSKFYRSGVKNYVWSIVLLLVLLLLKCGSIVMLLVLLLPKCLLAGVEKVHPNRFEVDGGDAVEVFCVRMIDAASFGGSSEECVSGHTLRPTLNFQDGEPIEPFGVGWEVVSYTKIGGQDATDHVFPSIFMQFRNACNTGACVGAVIRLTRPAEWYDPERRYPHFENPGYLHVIQNDPITSPNSNCSESTAGTIAPLPYSSMETVSEIGGNVRRLLVDNFPSVQIE